MTLRRWAERTCRRYPDIKVPVMIVAGADDRAVSYRAHSLRLHHDIPGRDGGIALATHSLHDVDGQRFFRGRVSGVLVAAHTSAFAASGRMRCATSSAPTARRSSAS